MCAKTIVCTGKQDEADITIETLKAIEHPISQQTIILVDSMSYAGTGNVLKIQSMLHMCLEHLNVPEASKSGEEGEGQQQPNGDASTEQKEVSDTHQAFAVLGIGLIAMGEEIGAEMSIRHFNHLVRLPIPLCFCS